MKVRRSKTGQYILTLFYKYAVGYKDFWDVFGIEAVILFV